MRRNSHGVGSNRDGFSDQRDAARKGHNTSHSFHSRCASRMPKTRGAKTCACPHAFLFLYRYSFHHIFYMFIVYKRAGVNCHDDFTYQWRVPLLAITQNK